MSRPTGSRSNFHLPVSLIQSFGRNFLCKAENRSRPFYGPFCRSYWRSVESKDFHLLVNFLKSHFQVFHAENLDVKPKPLFSRGFVAVSPEDNSDLHLLVWISNIYLISENLSKILSCKSCNTLYKLRMVCWLSKIIIFLSFHNIFSSRFVQ